MYVLPSRLFQTRRNSAMYFGERELDLLLSEDRSSLVSVSCLDGFFTTKQRILEVIDIQVGVEYQILQ